MIFIVFTFIEQFIPPYSTAELKAEAGDPEAIAEYEEYCRNEEKEREQSKAYFKERYRREHKREQMTRYNSRNS